MTPSAHKEQLEQAVGAFKQWLDNFVGFLPKYLREELLQYWVQTGVVLDNFVYERLDAIELVSNEDAPTLQQSAQ